MAELKMGIKTLVSESWTLQLLVALILLVTVFRVHFTAILKSGSHFTLFGRLPL
jgi:hypothetical protein